MSAPENPRAPQRGQAMVEYLVISAALAVALFVMVSPDINLPLIRFFLDRLAIGMQKFVYAMSTAY